MQPSIEHRPSPAEARRFFEDKLAFTTGPVELDHWIRAGEDDLVVVDVRAAEDYAAGHLPGAVNIPQEQWDTPSGLRKNKTNVVYCYTQQCHLAAKACARFAADGYPVMEMDGGFEAWKEHELEVEEQLTHRYPGPAGRTGSNH